MLTKQQKQKMQKMLGFSNGKTPKVLLRNFWAGKDDDLDGLVAVGFAQEVVSFQKKSFYSLTPSGIDEIMGQGWSLEHKDELIENDVLAIWEI